MDAVRNCVCRSLKQASTCLPTNIDIVVVLRLQDDSIAVTMHSTSMRARPWHLWKKTGQICNWVPAHSVFWYLLPVPLLVIDVDVPSLPVYGSPRSPLVLVTTVVIKVDVTNGNANMAVDLFSATFEICLSSARDCIFVASVSPPDDECMTRTEKQSLGNIHEVYMQWCYIVHMLTRRIFKNILLIENIYWNRASE